MSEDKVAWTWRHAIIKSDLPSTTRHVLLTISCFMNELGDGCYPTQEQLAEATGLSDRAVRGHLDVAEKAGWITRKEHGFKGQKWRNHEYVARWPDDKKVRNHVPDVLDEGAEPRSSRNCEGAEPDDKKVRNHVPTTSPVIFPEKDSLSETSSDTPKPTKKRKSYPEPFEALWKAYPTDANMSKKEAFDAWKRLDEDDRAATFASVPSFVAYCKAHPDYRPIHLCRYIAKRRFEGHGAAATPSHSTTPASIRRERDSHLSPEELRQAWIKRLEFCRRRREWMIALMGPPPGHEDCLVPDDLLTEHDRNFDWYIEPIRGAA